MSFLPTASWSALRRRAELLDALREFFRQRDFLEVETPILSADIVVDRHLDPFSTILADEPGRPEVGRRLWLQTSPEFALKRLMAAGGEAIFQVAKVFRNGERGPFHNPEFTLVEWYRRGDDMQRGMCLLSDLCEALLQKGPADQLSYAAALEQYAGIDPHAATCEQLRARAEELGVVIPAGLSMTDRDAWLDLLLVEVVQPKLGQGRPTLLFDFPASQAALAVVRDERPPVAERFELFVAGIELANGYHELRDAEELCRRASQANQMRVVDHKPPLPEESRLLQAMQHGLPPCSGAALGFDRLVMAALGATHINQVLPFPIDRA